MKTPLVEVLMSTYNGERFVREQIDSILNQTDVTVRLVIRDDGSTDGTLSVLQEYATDPRVRIHAGQNIGLPDCFFRLVQESSHDADFWALSDQDDVWLPHKLARAVSRLAECADGPSLYCARVLAVDETMRPLGPHPLPRRGPSFENALVQNIATGCTIVLNPAARTSLVDRWPEYAAMHDAWLYLVLSGIGQVLYDPEMVVCYRQHGSNAVGVSSGALARLMGRVRRQLTPSGAGAHGRQNAALARTHGDLLSPSAALQLKDFLASRGSLRKRSIYAARGAAHRQTVGSDVVLKALHILGRV